MINDNDVMHISYMVWSRDVMRAIQHVLQEKNKIIVTGVETGVLEKLFSSNYGIWQAANWIVKEEEQSITLANGGLK